MTSIYILSTPEKSQQDMYKLGKHSGTESKLVSRYITALPDVYVHLFEETSHAEIVENKLKEKLIEKRIINCRGNLSEWININLERLERMVKRTIRRTIRELIKNGVIEPYLECPEFISGNSPKSTPDEILSKYLSCLSEERCMSEDYWLKIGIIIKNVGGSLMLYSKWSCSARRSEQNKKYEECKKVWYGHNQNHGKEIGLTTLKRWAHEDNMEKYIEITKDDKYGLEEIFEKFLEEKEVNIFSMVNLFYNIYPDNYMYCSTTNSWYTLNNNGIYEPGNLSIIYNFRVNVYEYFDYYFCRKFNIANMQSSDRNTTLRFKNEFGKMIQRLSRTESMAREIIRDMRTKYLVGNVEDVADNNPNIFAFKNGVIDLETGEFRNARPEEMVTINCGYNYVPYYKEVKEDVLKVLHDIYQEEDLYEYVMRVFSIIISGVNKRDEHHFLIGSGDNSKGVGVVTEFLRNTFGLQDIFISNHDPKIDGSDKGNKRRCRYIPHNASFVENPKGPRERKIDFNLKEKIRNDEYKSAFFDILLKYYQEIKANDYRFPIPGIVLRKTEEYMYHSDPLKKFIDEEIIITGNNDDRIASSDLFNRFYEFNDGNAAGYNKINFKKRLVEDLKINHAKGRSCSYFWGVKYKYEKEDDKAELEFQ